MTEIEQAILLLVANGYAVFQPSIGGVTSWGAPDPKGEWRGGWFGKAPDAEVEEAALGKANYTVSEFCMKYGIGRTFFYDLIKHGRGPAIVKVGRKTLVPREAAEAWCAALGDAA